MKVIIAGGRDEHLTQKDKDYILSLVADSTITTLVCGMAKGIDMDAHYLLRGKVPIKEFPAQWNNLLVENCVVKYTRQGKAYNALAGHNRNEAMAQYAEGVILFEGGTGTANMYKVAKQYGLKIIGDFRELLY